MEMNLAPTYRLTLGKTYYENGFFNLGVGVDRFVRPDNGPITIELGDGKAEIQGRVDRRANLNGTPRILGGAELRNWLQSNFELGDTIDVSVLASDRLVVPSNKRGTSDLTNPSAKKRRVSKRPTLVASAPIERRDRARLSGESIQIGNRRFRWVCQIDPERDAEGSVRQFFPQARYANENNLTLNRYGAGPFCKFAVPSNLPDAGVYAISVDHNVRYIGETIDLSSRYNAGYGNISPRNCFSGGQETNCRLNNLIFDAANAGSQVDLWFCPTNQYKAIEAELRKKLRPSWNGI